MSGKTVSKSRRGTVTGTATSVSAAVVLAFGVTLWSGPIPLTTTSISVVLIVAGACWRLAGTLFARVTNDAGAAEGGRNGIGVALGCVSLR